MKKENMTILKKYNEPDAEWEKTTLVKATENLEGSGYWKKDTVENMLEEGIELLTPWAFFKKQ